jgi:hypothetical protein
LPFRTSNFSLLTSARSAESASSAPAVVSSGRVVERTRLANTKRRSSLSISPITQLARSSLMVPLPVLARTSGCGHASAKSWTPAALVSLPGGIVIAAITVSTCRRAIGSWYEYIRFRKAICSRGEIVSSPFSQNASTGPEKVCDP